MEDVYNAWKDNSPPAYTAGKSWWTAFRALGWVILWNITKGCFTFGVSMAKGEKELPKIVEWIYKAINFKFDVCIKACGVIHSFYMLRGFGLYFGIISDEAPAVLKSIE